MPGNASSGLKGSKNKAAKLMEHDIEVIRELYKFGRTQANLAKLYNISQSQISRIIGRKWWKGVLP